MMNNTNINKSENILNTRFDLHDSEDSEEIKHPHLITNSYNPLD
jgi:hypothetical protein